MNKTNTLAINPLFPIKIRIDSSATYRAFSKNHFKYLGIVEVKFFHSRFGNRTRAKILTKKLLNIASKLKQVQVVRVHRALAYCPKRCDPLLHKTIKKFSKIKSLSVNLSEPSYGKIMTNYIRWLKLAKYLKSLYFIFRKYYGGNDIPQKLQDQLELFFKTLKRKKLQSLKLSVKANLSESFKSFLIFKEYPSTLKNLALSWKARKSSLFKFPFSESELSLAHLKSLQNLNLSTPIPIGWLNRIVSSVPNPSNVNIIALEPFQGLLNKKVGASNMLQIVNSFKNLQSIKLTLNNFSVLSHAFVKSLGECPIKEFDLDVVVKKSINLVLLGQLFGAFDKLEILILRARFAYIIRYEIEECYFSFFSKISELKKVQKLKLYFLGETDKELSPIPFVRYLVKCIEAYEHLKCISFKYYQKSSSEDWIAFLMTLRQRAAALRTMRLDFDYLPLSQEVYSNLISLLQEVKNVKMMALYDCNFEEKEQFVGITNCIASLKHLTLVKLFRISGEVYRKDLASFLNKLLIRKGLKTFSCTRWILTQKSLEENVEEFERVDIRKIVKKNPELRIANVPFDIFSSNSDINYCKWEH